MVLQRLHSPNSEAKMLSGLLVFGTAAHRIPACVFGGGDVSFVGRYDDTMTLIEMVWCDSCKSVSVLPGPFKTNTHSKANELVRGWASWVNDGCCLVTM